jgi:hypothetical protein
MFVPFDKISPASKIWIFQSSRAFTAEEETTLMNSGKNFVEQWTAHKQNLLGSMEILHHLFIIIAVDQTVNDASGCSIDKAFGFIRNAEKDLHIDLLDRRAIAYEQNGTIHLTNPGQFEKLFKEGKVNASTIIYNNLVETKQGLSQNWRQQVKESWLMQLM